MEIKISAKAFAEFVLGSPSKKTSTIRGILTPRSAESQIPMRYYARAIRIIRRYHNNENSLEGLREDLQKLDDKCMSAETSQARAQLSRNLMAVKAYMRVFAGRTWKIISCPRTIIHPIRFAFRQPRI